MEQRSVQTTPPPSQSACFSKVQGTECSGFYILDNIVELGMDLVFFFFLIVSGIEPLLFSSSVLESI